MTFCNQTQILIAGNFKMNIVDFPNYLEDLVNFLDNEKIFSEEEYLQEIDLIPNIAIIPPYIFLPAFQQELDRKIHNIQSKFKQLLLSKISLGAQNVCSEKNGAYTGEISASMLANFHVKYVLIGHSERREIFHETDELVQKKIRRVIDDSSMIPLICVGETALQKKSNRAIEVIHQQLEQALLAIKNSEIEKLIFAYEPIWAIGTGLTATPELAEEMHQMIREYLSKLTTHEIAQKIPILYGGSVTEENSQNLLLQKNINGLLVGGASLNYKRFAHIIRNIQIIIRQKK